MQPKKQLTFAAFVILASKIARNKAQAYKPDVDDGGYFTPYFPTDAYGGSNAQPTETTTKEDEQPAPTAPPEAENAPYSEEDADVPTTAASTSVRVKPTSPPDNKQYTPVTETLSDGSSYQKGSFNNTLKWQSTGVLKHGGCPIDALIGDCYSMYLDAEGMLEPMKEPEDSKGRFAKRLHARELITREEHEDPYDPPLGIDSPHHYFKSLAVNVAKSGSLDDMNKDSDLMNWKAMASSNKPPCKAKAGAKDPNAEPPAPRQRMEFLSWPPAPAGEIWDYTWRTYVDERTTTTNRWWHMMQLLQRSGCGGYVTAQTAMRKSVDVKDKNRSCPNDKCDSYDYALYKGKTLLHHIRVRYGEDGVFSYKVRDLNLERTILEYNAVGDMGSSSSVKFGIYRQAVEGMSEARIYVGDYVAEKVA